MAEAIHTIVIWLVNDPIIVLTSAERSSRDSMRPVAAMTLPSKDSLLGIPAELRVKICDILLVQRRDERDTAFEYASTSVPAKHGLPSQKAQRYYGSNRLALDGEAVALEHGTPHSPTRGGDKITFVRRIKF
jgi:hypothetical protein